MQNKVGSGVSDNLMKSKVLLLFQSIFPQSKASSILIHCFCISKLLLPKDTNLTEWCFFSFWKVLFWTNLTTHDRLELRKPKKGGEGEGEKKGKRKRRHYAEKSGFSHPRNVRRFLPSCMTQTKLEWSQPDVHVRDMPCAKHSKD